MPDKLLREKPQALAGDPPAACGDQEVYSANALADIADLTILQQQYLVLMF